MSNFDMRLNDLRQIEAEPICHELLGIRKGLVEATSKFGLKDRVKCGNCGELIQDSSKCPKCGVTFGGEIFQCPICNAMVSADTLKCDNCGAEFETAEK